MNLKNLLSSFDDKSFRRELRHLLFNYPLSANFKEDDLFRVIK